MNTSRQRQFKDTLFEEFARIGKALSAGRRLELLDLLAQGERGVEDLAAESAMSVANASQHLQVLRQARLVEGRREGNFVRYRLADEEVLRLWLSLRQLAESRLAEVERLVGEVFTDRAEWEAIGSGELRRRLKEGSALVLDVRPAVEYAAGHIGGARSIPVKELRKRLREVPKSKMIVAYCRGPYCVYADEAVSLLREEGYDAYRLAVGFPEWRMEGGEVGQARESAC